MGKKSVCTFLPWDSEFFGVRLARLVSDRLSPSSTAAIEEWCQSQAIDCLCFLADATDRTTEALAEEYGYEQVDVRLTLERTLSDLAENIDDPEATIRRSREEDLPHLSAIARASHGDSRFYADPGFSRESCDRLYENLLARSCRGHSEVLWVLECRDRPVGYISCHRHDETVGQIGLLGVDTEFRGRGFGQRLVQASLIWFAEQGLELVEVVTQERNQTAQRLYRRNSFQTRLAQVWYHRWFKTSAKRAA